MANKTGFEKSHGNKLTGTVADLKANRITHLLVYCDNHNCMHTGKLKLGNYFDHTPVEAIRKAVYCPVCRAAGQDDRNLDVRPEWLEYMGPGEKVNTR